MHAYLNSDYEYDISTRIITAGLIKRSYMSVHVLLYLLLKLSKSDGLSLFCNELTLSVKIAFSLNLFGIVSQNTYIRIMFGEISTSICVLVK